jgi:hypothetical protein
MVLKTSLRLGIDANKYIFHSNANPNDAN